jgi:hypothetical protein
LIGSQKYHSDSDVLTGGFRIHVIPEQIVDYLVKFKGKKNLCCYGFVLVYAQNREDSAGCVF